MPVLLEIGSTFGAPRAGFGDKPTAQKPGLFHGPCDGADVQSSSTMFTENGVDGCWLWRNGLEAERAARVVPWARAREDWLAAGSAGTCQLREPGRKHVLRCQGDAGREHVAHGERRKGYVQEVVLWWTWWL